MSTPKPGPANPALERSAPGQRPTSTRMWLYRLLSAVLVPGCAFGSLELVLRLGGYGHETSFFHRERIGGKEVLLSNPWFGLSFFPPAVARSPQPMATPAVPEDGVCRIFLFGESAAMGDPKPAYGMGRVLEVLLRERFPERHFEVVCTAMTAINSHAILAVANECARYRADFWVVYMGNNEMAGPFGANTVFGARALPARLVRVFLAVQSTRTGQWFAAMVRQLNPSPAGESWEGLRIFESHFLPSNAPAKQRVYANFRHNLDGILHAAQRAKAAVVLSTVASNLRDCAPFGSRHAPPLAPAEEAAWKQKFLTALTHAIQARTPDSLVSLDQVLARSPGFAEAHFRMGNARLRLGEVEQARRDFVASRDLDALPFRADSTLNRIVRETAQRWSSRQVALVDGEAALAQGTGILGSEVFYEHVHLRFAGNYRLARALAERIAGLLPPAAAGGAPGEWPSLEHCARQLGLTDWNRAAALEETIQRLAEPPFVYQWDHATQLQRLDRELADLRGRATPSRRDDARAGFEELLRSRPKDPWLHQSYAEFLSSGGEWAAAAARMELVRDLVPRHYAANLQLGRLQARQKRFKEAQQSIEQALLIKPDLPDARLELARLSVARNQPADALEQLRQQIKLRPHDPAPHLLRAKILAEQNRGDEAAASFREAIRLRPSAWEPRYLLGMHFILKKQFAEAQKELEQVLKLRPDFATGHLNLGYALARQNQFDKAIAQFQQTLELEPTNAQARQFLESVAPLQTPAPP